MLITLLILLVTGHVLAVVPFIAHKQDAFVTGVIVTAVIFPTPGMARGDVQIDWRTISRDIADGNWLTIDHLRFRLAADLNLTEKSGLTDTQRNPSVVSMNRRGENGRGGEGEER